MSELKTCFKKVDYDLAGLLHYIEIGDIGLPDIQRPFVWSNAKVRDLFDSITPCSKDGRAWITPASSMNAASSWPM